MQNIVRNLTAGLFGKSNRPRSTFAITIFWNERTTGKHYEKILVIGEKKGREMCPECERWRMAGRDVGRSLGVVQERKRLLAIFESYASVALASASIGEANVWREAIRAAKGENK